MRHSGLQLEVLALYRSLLRVARPKGEEVHAEVRRRFREISATMTTKEIEKIEHFIRYGKKQRAMLQMPGLTGLRHIS